MIITRVTIITNKVVSLLEQLHMFSVKKKRMYYVVNLIVT